MHRSQGNKVEDLRYGHQTPGLPSQKFGQDVISRKNLKLINKHRKFIDRLQNKGIPFFSTMFFAKILKILQNLDLIIIPNTIDNNQLDTTIALISNQQIIDRQIRKQY